MANDDIQGTVTDADGNAVGGAIVALWDQDNPNEVVTTTADSNGDYIFKTHPDADGTATNWHLTARDPNDGTRQFPSLHSVSAQITTAIPNDGLVHHYDATKISGSDGDSIGTWTDLEGGADLTQSTSSDQPTLKTNQINGKQVLRGDGSDDFMDVGFSDLSQPYEIFMVFELQSGATDGGFHFIFDDDNDARFGKDSDDKFQIYQGDTQVIGSTADLNTHFTEAIFRDGANNNDDEYLLDGTSDAVGDSGDSILTGLTVFSRLDGGLPANVDVGEVGVYNDELSASTRDELESYISNKWDITF